MAKSRRVTGGALISARLSELGWSQTDLATKLGVGTGTVSRWVSEEREPSLPAGVELAKVLDVDVADLISTKRSGTAA